MRKYSSIRLRTGILFFSYVRLSQRKEFFMWDFVSKFLQNATTMVTVRSFNK